MNDSNDGTEKKVADPNLYVRMCEPRETAEEANDALFAFLDEVAVLREKHRISNVVIAATAVGPEKVHMTVGFRGETTIAAILSTRLYEHYSLPILNQLTPKVDDNDEEY